MFVSRPRQDSGAGHTSDVSYFPSPSWLVDNLSTTRQQARCRWCSRSYCCPQVSEARLPGMTTALLNVGGGCQVTSSQRRCSWTAVQSAHNLHCRHSLVVGRHPQRALTCQAQAGAAVAAPSPQMAVRLRRGVACPMHINGHRNGAHCRPRHETRRCYEAACVKHCMLVAYRGSSSSVGRAACSASSTGHRAGSFGTGRTAPQAHIGFTTSAQVQQTLQSAELRMCCLTTAWHGAHTHASRCA